MFHSLSKRLEQGSDHGSAQSCSLNNWAQIHKIKTTLNFKASTNRCAKYQRTENLPYHASRPQEQLLSSVTLEGGQPRANTR